VVAARRRGYGSGVALVAEILYFGCLLALWIMIPRFGVLVLASRRSARYVRWYVLTGRAFVLIMFVFGLLLLGTSDD
jgi:hypothetical protein